MPQHLTDLRLHEVSLVDSPANKGARVMLFKRNADKPLPVIKTAADLRQAIAGIHAASDVAKAKTHIRAAAKALKMESALPAIWTDAAAGVAVVKYLGTLDAKAGEIAKGYVAGQACDFDGARASMEASEAASELMQEVNDAVNALGASVWAIKADDSISDKGEAIKKSLEQFGDHIKTIVPEGTENALVAGALLDAGYTFNSLGGIELEKGADSMSLKAIAQKLGLPETASETEILNKMAAQSAPTVEAFDASEIAYIGKLKPETAAAFVVMKAADRKKKMKDMPEGDGEPEPDADDMKKAIQKGDAFADETGVVFTKKDFGSDKAFQLAKSQAATIAKQAEDIQKGKDDADKTARITKATTALVHIGKADAVGGLLHRIAKHDPKLADEVETMFKSANTLIEKGELFKEHGNGVAKEGSATDLIQKGAEAIRKADPKITIEKARSMFREQNPEIKKREDEEAKAARSN